MSYGYFRQYPQLPRVLYRNRNASIRAVPPGLWVTGTVYSTVGATTATVLAMAEDHYGVSTLDALAAKIDPHGEVDGTPRSMEDFCQAWWGRPYADCIHEILLWERWLNLIRQSSLRQDPVLNLPLHYYGGDMLDTTTISSESNRRVWVGADYPLTSKYCVNLSTNVARTDELPLRNHVTAEFLNGETDRYGHTRTADAIGGGFRSMNLGVSTYATPNATTWPGHIYWNLTAMPSSTAGNLYWVFASLVETPTDGPAFWDLEVKDTHVYWVESTFGSPVVPTTASSAGVFGIGPAGTFYVYGFLADTTHNYFYGIEFSPPSGDFTPNHGQNILTTDTEYTRIARLPVATNPDATGHTGTVYTDYEFWTGSGWSSDLANAARIVDTGGTPIKGYFHAAKIASGHYMAISQGYPETVKHCYYSTTPTGPWWNYKNVPTPPIGPDKPEAGQQRTNGYNKLLTFAPARTDHVMTMGTHLVFNAVTKVGKHIGEMDTPYVISVPTKDAAGVDQSTPPPSAVHRMRPLLVR